jgi:hypothetical protein
MKKIVLLNLGLALSFVLMAADSSFTINGKLDKVKTGKIFLSIYAGGTPAKDSAVIKNGRFRFKGISKDPVQAVLSMESKPSDYFLFYLEPRTLSVNGAGDSLKLLSISGSPINDDDKLLKQRLADITKWEESLNKMYGDAIKAKNKTVTDSLDEVSDIILKEKRKVIAAYVKDYPHSIPCIQYPSFVSLLLQQPLEGQGKEWW